MSSSTRSHQLGPAALAGCLITGLALSCAGPTREPAQEQALPSKPHPVVVVAVDGVRADALVGASGAAVATPNLQALAAESIRFEWAFAQAPSFSASLAALLSGSYPTTNGLLEEGDRLQEAAETLAESFAAAGLPAVAFVEGQPGGTTSGSARGSPSGSSGLSPACARWTGSSSSATGASWSSSPGGRPATCPRSRPTSRRRKGSPTGWVRCSSSAARGDRRCSPRRTSSSPAPCTPTGWGPWTPASASCRPRSATSVWTGARPWSWWPRAVSPCRSTGTSSAARCTRR